MTERSARTLRILAPTRYPWRFNGPRRSRHRIENRPFLPLNWVSGRLEGTTVLSPWPPRRFDLTHAFNRIPLGSGPFVIGFESHLPRAFGLEAGGYYRALRRMLAAPRCRRIVAISNHAHRIFTALHHASPQAPELFAKLARRYPSVPVPEQPDALADASASALRIAFVGAHFARKGGCVAVRMAELARERRIPLTVEVVSRLDVGGRTWTDPLDPRFFDRYRALLRLPNVVWHGALANGAIHALLRRSHLSLLTTFSDTFGYGAIESMINGTPVIATAQGALPEFIQHGRNGILLPLDVSDLGEWVHLGRRDRGGSAYARLYAGEIDRLAEEGLAAATALLDDPARLRAMRRAARCDAAERFGTREADLFWDALYEGALDSRTASRGTEEVLS